MNPTRTESIKRFLQYNTHQDLAELYNYNMEVQVNVAQDGGRRVEDDYKGRQWHGWTDELETWKTFRIPYNAATDPEYEDKPMSFNLDHAEGIGMTGWDWVNRQSLWFGFDFDKITEHSKGLTDAQLAEVESAAEAIPWTTIRRSTSGNGRHIHVFCTPTNTNTHTEHAALGRSILGTMSALTGFDFHAKVDVAGGNMWIWHRKMKGTNGLTLIKKGTILEDIPINWRDHISVILGKRHKLLPQFIEETNNKDSERLFEELTGQRPKIQLDEDHKKLINWLKEHNALWYWDNDHWLACTHTIYLKEAHEELGFKGIFKTIATGKDRGNDLNCFSGNTEILTKNGLITIKEAAQNKIMELYVRTDRGMEWVPSIIRSFGVKETHKLKFGDNYKCNVTDNHSWFFHRDNNVDFGRRRNTWEIKTKKTLLPLCDINLPNIDWQGYAHGFVFGDGTINNKYTQVNLFKKDNDLLKMLCRFGNPGQQKAGNGEYVNYVRQLPIEWKQLPNNPTKSYALGFVLGLASADCSITSDSSVQIKQSDEWALNKVRNLAIYAGLRTNPVRQCYCDSEYPNARPRYILTINTYNLTSDHFLRQDHKLLFKSRKNHHSITVANIDWSYSTTEEVFCAVVPHWGNFTLANGVITGNCFAFPLRNGAWIVRRFTPGVTEDAIWDQDSAGWTRTYFNRNPDLQTAARSNEGNEHPSGGFAFRHAEQAQKSIQMLGGELNLPTWAAGKKAKIKERKDGKLIIQMDYDTSDNAIPGWIQEGKAWKKVVSISGVIPNEPDMTNLDELVRHLVSQTGDNAGWVWKSDDCDWYGEPFLHVKTALKGKGWDPKETDIILGTAISRPWILVNKPFKEEYTGDREWNKNAAQFRFYPTQEREHLHYPHWLKILNHIGKGLDNAITNHEWSKNNGILTGGDYLKCWIASLFQFPEEPLPYLFLHSAEQGTGKSILHEALKLLVTHGVERADVALKEQRGFNEELRNAILCVVEETDLRRDKEAYNKIKDWVTSRTILIHPKGGKPYSTLNTTHFLHCSNDFSACPVFKGDTRITMIEVPLLLEGESIPRKQLETSLIKEAPDFLASILSLEIPPSPDRLNVPIIITEQKSQLENANQTLLEIFISENCHEVSGKMISFTDFCDKFWEIIGAGAASEWSKIRISKELPLKYPAARIPSTGYKHIGNLSFEAYQEGDIILPKLIVKDGKLVPEK